MGNEQSDLSAVDINDKPVEVRDFWTHHYGSISKGDDNSSKLSVFVGEILVDGPLWKTESPLQIMCKNLMIYRHPCIVKYISTWQKPSKCYLATEEVTPLSLIVSKLTTLEICIGLYSILKALCFLHDKAGVSHNNINVSAIYITSDCSWKLGAMHFSCKYKDLTMDYLNKAKQSGCCASSSLQNGIYFEKIIKFCVKKKDVLDVYGFSSLAAQLLGSKNDENHPSLSAFKDYCKEILSTTVPTSGPTLSAILNHEFFNNNFLKIHSFLVELPLKNDSERTAFFLALYEELKSFDSELVGAQLSSLILSRLVFLDKTAQTHLLPYVLCLKTQEEDGGLFPEEVFKKHIAPKLIKIMSVRDIQIRLILLKHFSNFVGTFSEDELQTHILPELLLGIKDSNSELVSATLRVLADLVSILGPQVVIGGQRAKLFNDGRPVTHETTRRQSLRLPRQTSNADAGRTIANVILGNESTANTTTVLLPERPSPDGEEGETSGTEEIDLFDNDDLDNWDEWNNDITENINIDRERVECAEGIGVLNELSDEHLEINKSSVSKDFVKSYSTIKPIVDITQLDIKNQSDLGGGDVNFFQDMEPVIDTKAKYVIQEASTNNQCCLGISVSNKLILAASDEQEDGWGTEEWS